MVEMVAMAKMEARDTGMTLFCTNSFNESIYECLENRGSNATRFSRGTDGGPGGDGGNGGNAGRGGDAGSGGTIRISVPKTDTYLLVLCGIAKYSGGIGGSAGKPGSGGQSFQGYLRPLSKINFSNRQWRKGWGRR